MESLLLGVEALSFLQEEGFPVLKSLLAHNEDDAARKALEIGLPVTLKPSSPDVIHKTETGGIRVSLRDEAEVRQAFREIAATFTTNYPEKRLDGVMVQKQGSGLEVIVGMLRDQQFGPVLMFGLGGVFVEAMKDVTFRLIPIEKADAKDMMEELKGYDVLRNPRSGSLDLPAVEKSAHGYFNVHRPSSRSSGNGPEPRVRLLSWCPNLRRQDKGRAGFEM